MWLVGRTLLDISTLEERGPAALRSAPSRPLELIGSAVGQVAPVAAQKSIALEVAADGVLPAVNVVDDKVVRVLVNLLGNAVKFFPPKGHVEITARRMPDSDCTVHFTVNDTGIGIPPGSRLFDEGFRLDTAAPSRLSTGLGLTFCKRVTEAHGGKIWFHSEPGRRSAFHVTLPLED